MPIERDELSQSNFKNIKEVLLDPLSREISQRMESFEQRIIELRTDYKETVKTFDAVIRMQSDPITGVVTRAEFTSKMEKIENLIDTNRRDAEKALTSQSKWAIGGIIAVLFQVIQFMAQLLTTGHLHI